MPGCRGASSGGRGGGGTVGARIRGLGVSGGVLGDHTIWGGVGVATRNTGPYILFEFSIGGPLGLTDLNLSK